MQPQRPRSSVVSRSLATIALCAGVFVLPNFVHAALTTPTTVISGAQYGQRALGWFNPGGFLAIPNEPQHLRRVLYLEPEAGLKIILVAYVNDDAAACTGTICRLEFKMSKDSGITWTRPFDSSQQWLPIETQGTNNHFTLVADPGGEHVWVAYRANVSGIVHTLIRKLPWSQVNKIWSIRDAATLEHRADDVTHSDSALLGLYVQPAGASNERVWGITKYWGGSQYFYRVVYADNFSTATPTWNVAKDTVGADLDFGWSSPFNLAGPDHTFAFVPMGSVQAPAIAVLGYWLYGVNGSDVCANSIQHTSYGLEVYTLQTATNANSWFASPKIRFVDPQPYQWVSDADDDCTPAGAPAFSSGNFSMNFSVATVPIDADTSRVVVAYRGGYSTITGYAFANANRNTVYVRSCEMKNGTNTTTACTSATSIGASAQAPSVGFVGSTAYVAMRDVTTNDLVIYRETSVGSPYTWAQELAAPNVSSTVFSPSLPLSATSLTLNSSLPPVVWDDDTAKQVQFTANSGGNVFAWGWSSNFGWLASNCALFKTATDCQPYAYGMSIGTTAVDSPVAKNFSPSPAAGKTYPVSGYGWSSNAGFLSFSRSDSVCVNPGCTDVNTYGNPPGQAYRNSTSTADPTAKYDKSTQKLQGWGRFLALCNYDIPTQRCLNATGGWVHFQGYWASPTAVSSTLTVQYTNSGGGGNTQLSLLSSVGFPDPAVSGHDEVGVIGNEYFYYYQISGNVLFVRTMDDILKTYPVGTTVKAVTGNDGSGNPNGGEYGVNAYFTGNGYQLSGWAWSTEYGWIRFNPLIFIGYAWLETLYGNIYVNGSATPVDAGDVVLPDAQTLSYERLHTCGASGTEPCYVSTYRIEANGTIQTLQFDATGQFVAGGSSAVGYLRQLGEDPLTSSTPVCGFGGSVTACAAASGGFGANDANLQALLLQDSGSQPSTYGFPAVTPSSGTYRNALGKLDVGGLTTTLATPNIDSDIVGYTKDIGTGTNRFGNKVFIANETSGTPVSWTVGELLGQTNLTCILLGPPEVCPDSTYQWPLGKLQNHVVHVQGDLVVGQDPDPAKPATTTFASIARNQGAGGTLTVASTANFPTSGTLILETGEAKEEYLSYTGKAATQFTGVKSISGVPSSEHASGTPIRWVWRWPFDPSATKPQNLTIVVDGNLQINYNIIASDTTKDQDILNAALPNIGIKNAQAVAFVVKGNVLIAKDVNRITGAYIVTSRDTTGPADSMDTASSTISNCANPPGQYPGCGGVFTTGIDNDASLCTGSDKQCNPLTIEGLLFARLFSFQRTGNLESIDTPAEQVVFDQRLFLNPPPGLEDVTKALPNPTRQLP